MVAKAKARGKRSAAAVPEEAAERAVWTFKRRPTINDVARLARVSKKTISRVINESPSVHSETRRRIETIIQDIGYKPDPQARGLASQRSFLLGLVYDNPNAQYIVNIQDGVLEACRGSGYELVVHPCDRRQPNFLQDVRQFVERQKLDGVILLPPVSEGDDLARMLAETECRYVRIVASSLDQPQNMVVYRDRVGASEVAEHLIGLGHRRIGFIAGPAHYRSAHEREGGFCDRLAEHAIRLAGELKVEGAYTFESGEAAGEKLLDLNPRPTAIFASNDEMAAGVYKAAFRRGLSIPQDLSVVGFDDSPLASRLWPGLTTVRLPIKQMGRLAAERLVRRAAKETIDGAGDEVVGHLVIRESTAPLARSGKRRG